MIDFLEEFIIDYLGGRAAPATRWDTPNLDCFNFEIETKEGTVVVAAFKKKNGCDWPKYKCSGDSFRDKFSVFINEKSGRRKQVTNGFVEITEDNIVDFLGIFKH